MPSYFNVIPFKLLIALAIFISISPDKQLYPNVSFFGEQLCSL